MSRWRQDPNGAAAELVRRSLASLELSGRCLLANSGGLVADVLRESGLDVTAWSRRASDVGNAKPWPEAAPYDCVLLRLAKSKDEQEMTLAACLGALRDGGSLVLFGGNDEGIRSAINALEALCGPSETVSTKGHGRMVRVSRPSGPIARAQLGDWRRTLALDIGGTRRDWVTYPGLFAADRLDEGTSLMLSALPNLRAVARVLDYGCGSGVIAGAMQARLPGGQIDVLDVDSVALLAAAENVPGATTILGPSLKATGTMRYDAILSNPPLHAGVGEDHSALERLMAQAPKHLRPGGILQMVVQRRLPLGQSLEPLFSEHSIVAETSRFRVWRALTR
jgi:16S rRNA (guanine1207-N2)-methyltransferase